VTLAAADFAAFADLKDLTGATDDQLAAMLARGCADLPTVNFEDAQSEVLCRLFRHVTGIPWVRGWQEALRPDAVTTVPDGQYGTVWLLSATPVGAPVTTHRDTRDGAGNIRADKCEEVAQLMRYTWQIDVYRDAGAATRREETPVVQHPAGSALDVMLRLSIALDHIRVRQAAREHCITWHSPAVTGARNLPQPLVQNTYESRATAELTTYGTPVSTIRVPTFGPDGPDWTFDWTFDCP
jgi:hypothetical protein